ncbi:MAG TPA: phosphatase PAP2 family protein [Fimbriimonadaceae bacterium]|nr:phosphatase PAP2 family protein [Fimbriimonadaceae bacterium]
MRWLYDFDMSGFRLIDVDLHREWLTPLFLALTFTALGWSQTILALCLLFWRKARPFVIPLLLGDLFAGFIIADGLKEVVRRQRPSNLSWAVVGQRLYGDNSFPSGHTATAFGVACTLWLLTRKTERAWIGHAALVWAVLVGISRVYLGVHWPTDVIAGAFAGLAGASGVMLVRPKGWLTAREED